MTKNRIPFFFVYSQAYKEGKKERPPFAHDPEPVIEKPEIPEDLLCNICKDLLTDAVMIPCCGNSFCDECKYFFSHSSFVRSVSFLSRLLIKFLSLFRHTNVPAGVGGARVSGLQREGRVAGDSDTESLPPKRRDEFQERDRLREASNLQTYAGGSAASGKVGKAQGRERPAGTVAGRRTERNTSIADADRLECLAAGVHGKAC